MLLLFQGTGLFFEVTKAARLIKDMQEHQYLSIVRAKGQILDII